MKTAFDLLTKETQKEFWAALALRHCKCMTPRLIRTLLARHGSAYEAFCATSNQKILTSCVPKKIIPNVVETHLRQEKWRTDALHEWHLSKSFQGEIILWTDYRYPLGLKRIIDAPAFFYAQGDTSLLASPSVAIVGSRKYHAFTLEKTYEIAHDLSSCGICVISGMAKGIDFAAHSGALRAIGKTIAVLGCGADIIYPPEHFHLYNEIKENGLILSEFAPQTKPLPQNFPIRNRLVSGLSEGVLVAEAAPRSGSLITARLALEQNRNVYVLRPVDESHSLGCHALIQDGAVPIEDALSIIADIAPHLQEKFALEYEGTTPIEDVISLEKGNISRKNNAIAKQTQEVEQIEEVAKTSEEENFIAQKKAKKTEKKAEKKAEAVIENIEGQIPARPLEQASEQALGQALKQVPEYTSGQALGQAQKKTTTHPQEQALKKIRKQIKGDTVQKIDTSKIYLADQLRKRPQLDKNLSILDINFATMANELMGATHSYKASDVLSQHPKNKRKHILSRTLLSKTMGKNQFSKSSSIDFQNPYIINKNINSNKVQYQNTISEDKKNIVAEPSKKRENLSELEKQILHILDSKIELVPDEILAQLPKDMQNISTLSMTLLMLEVEDYIVRLSGNRYRNL